MTTLRRAGFVAALSVAATLLAAEFRERAIGQDAIRTADAALAKSDWITGIEQARVAAESVAPWCPFSDQGFRALATIGHDAQARGDDPTALLAYEAMRSAAIETRTVWGTSSWRATAEAGLAQVATSTKDPSLPAISSDAMLTALRSDGSLHSNWMAILAASALAMSFGIVRFVPEAREGKRARLALAIATAGLVGYAVTLFSNPP